MAKSLSKKEQPKRKQSVSPLKKKQQTTSKRQTEWRSELAKLKAGSFSTHEEACHAMFDVLARRLGPITSEERKHLELLIETDPVLRNAVDRLVQRRSK